MSDEPRKTVIAHNASQGHSVLLLLWEFIKPFLLAGWKVAITVKPVTRSLEQNAAQWPILQAFSEQLKWPVNGEMVTMTDDEWKDVLTAAFRGERVRLAMGMSGGVVMLGMRTSKMSVREFSDWLEFLHSTAAMRGVVVYPSDAP